MLALYRNCEVTDEIIDSFVQRYASFEPPYQMADVARLVSALAKELPIRRVYLFGSYARGDQRFSSDIDLYVVRDRGFTFSDANIFRDALERVFRVDSDIVYSLDGCPRAFYESLAKDAVMLYDRK